VTRQRGERVPLWPLRRLPVASRTIQAMADAGCEARHPVPIVRAAVATGAVAAAGRAGGGRRRPAVTLEAARQREGRSDQAARWE
jgi:hypothetical protein